MNVNVIPDYIAIRRPLAPFSLPLSGSFLVLYHIPLLMCFAGHLEESSDDDDDGEAAMPIPQSSEGEGSSGKRQSVSQVRTYTRNTIQHA